MHRSVAARMYRVSCVLQLLAPLFDRGLGFSHAFPYLMRELVSLSSFWVGIMAVVVSSPPPKQNSKKDKTRSMSKITSPATLPSQPQPLKSKQEGLGIGESDHNIRCEGIVGLDSLEQLFRVAEPK